MNKILLMLLLLAFIAQADAKSVMFIHDWSDEGSIYNSDWDGYSNLTKMLESKGYNVYEKNPSAISLDFLEKYDIVVFSSDWNRVITNAEAKAFFDYVNQGGRLFLMGDVGVSENMDELLRSLNKIGKPMGIQFKHVMVCDSESHAYYRNDPDKGVDTPTIVKENMVNHSITRDVEKFAINWGCSLKINYPFKALAFTTENGWGDTNSLWVKDVSDWYCVNDDFEAVGKLPVLAAGEIGDGKVVAIGDGDMFWNAWLEHYDHKQLALNIFEWLGN